MQGKAAGDVLKILVFGNILVEQDSLPLKLLPKLRKKFPKIEFKELDAIEELENEGRDLIILDCAKGVKKVEIIDNLDKIETTKPYSMHDFDLGLTLKLLRKMRKIDSVKIIAIPICYEKRKALKEIKQILCNPLYYND